MWDTVQEGSGLEEEEPRVTSQWMASATGWVP